MKIFAPIVLKKLLFFSLLICLHFSFAQTLQEREAIAEGNIFYENEDYKSAIVEYSKALIYSANNVKANFNLGNAYYQTKQYQKAETHYQKAAEYSASAKEKADSYHNLGNSQMQQKNYAQAIKSYKKALSIAPKADATRYNLALALRLKNQNKEKSPKHSIKPSEFAKKMKAQASALAEKGLFNDALQLMQKALAKDSTVKHFENYIEKLQEITILDNLK
ncbi:tetratricopeptide repeat protein [Ornithobacterium rhinotracheale]|uniref:Tetratricopeptide repeat protein n=1 Tax=Ornithobacterium rhinotracheale TaxID=28251 RepID=A0A3R6ASX1_ORNRH|nr:tetratricopeptide repeat protein [Ornithobacterium rhinotracheale]QAR29890.1 tetratricopeptide repeat protein [Ornithobacterium rhinotracheale]